jgi:hypothetical protein
MPARTRSRSRRSPPRLEGLEDRCVPTLLGQQVFPLDYPWNQKITNAPVAANSAAIINNIITLNKSDGRLHPDFGQDYHTHTDLYGIPYNVVHGNSVTPTAISILDYADESDVVPVPLPANPVIEGDWQDGPRDGLGNRGDSHLLIFDVDNDVAYELYQASRPTDSDNTAHAWTALQESVWDMKSDTFRTVGWTSADAAGLSILAGLARPDEGLPVSQGGQGVINHAIRVTLQNNVILDQFIYPASHVANGGNNSPSVEPPMGARLRLKAGVDISQLNPEAKIIAQAMKDYGLVVADNGSDFFFSGASDAIDASNGKVLTWDDNDVQDTLHGLKSLHFSDFEVVDLTPVVTGLSVHTGAAGASVTVTGQNFSGAAGRLKVLFGNTPATSVTVVDDSHVLAVAPAGTGTVDVRVQSGVTTPADSENVKSTIFGYGTSAVSANDRFTYGGGSNQAPTVATPAAANPSPVVTGTTTALSVLGADDGGEGNLTYTWAVTAKPAGTADPTFSVNGTNAAKATTATFSGGGQYAFQVTIADAQGASVTSSVSVAVDQAPAITSAAGATFTVGHSGSFTVKTSGYPVPALSKAGALPGGVGFTDNHDGTATLSGTPAAGSDGTWTLTVTADNGVAPAATQTFTLTVGKSFPLPVVAVGTDAGTPATVAIYDSAGHRSTVQPYGGFTGGVRVATGDVNGDGVCDVVVGPGPGAGPTVKVYSGADGSLLASFGVYAQSFTGGLYVAAGDVLGLGAAQVVVGPGPTGGPVVKVYDLRSGVSLARSIQVFGSGYTGGVTVGAGDGVLAVGTASKGGYVKVFDQANLSRARLLAPFGSGFMGGVTVAAAGGWVAVGKATGSAQVDVFNLADLSLARVIQNVGTAPAAGYAGGTRVAWTRDGAGNRELLTGTGPGWAAVVQTWVTGTWQKQSGFAPFGGWARGVWVG